MQTLQQHLLLWLWRQLPNCVEMSRLSSRILDEPPSLKLRFKMWLHHRICAWCRRYTTQLVFLRDAAPKLRFDLSGTEARVLSPEARQRIIERLRAECRN